MDAQKLAEDHVDWFLKIVRPLMITEFLHGYRHGYEAATVKQSGLAGLNVSKKAVCKEVKRKQRGLVK